MKETPKLRKIQKRERVLSVLVITIFIVIFIQLASAQDPSGPDDIIIISNETKSSVDSKVVNISGGYIANMNITSTSKNTRWKAFVGNVLGTFTLDDASGATIYDWTFTSTSGRIYATRNSTRVNWANIHCSNITTLNQENIDISHSNPDDNVTTTFNATYNSGTGITKSGSHNSFFVGSVPIAADSCPTLNTYIANNSQNTDFEEIALHDGFSMVFTTILENNLLGYDGDTRFDFQMIVPENGTAGYTGATPYYIYVEIGS